MNKIFTLLLLLGFATLSAQEADRFTDNQSDRPHDPRTDQMNFVPNEVLVKFKDDVTISSGTKLKSAGISSVDKVLKAGGGSTLEKLFPMEKKLKSVQYVKDPQGRDMKIPSLHNIYKIKIPELKSSGSMPTDIFRVIEELKALPEVEYAEPNYIISISDFKPAGPEMTMQEAMRQPENSVLSETASGLVPNDPLYPSQWGIPATNIDDVWNTITGKTTSIIGILDTGVDWLHPDLAANIWSNSGEIPGNGIDDDGNGFTDDIRGWDFINNDNDPKDDNSHGTHCAGIAAAVGNNGIGIAGVNWKAKIMPIKVFQSSGFGDIATIALGVTYAASNGANIISMSFGSYSESLTLKNALASAYATAVLVAAAGNDALCIGPGLCPDRKLGQPMYPGAYSFVLGVEANANTDRAGFSNYDQDGPVFSQYPNLQNYELKAPGQGILSCVPGGNYREYSGTSMAAPLVAGAVSLYREIKPTESQEMVFGNFINSLSQHIDLLGALNVVPVPKLDIVSYEITDTIDGDRDGRADAGETIELKVKVRNTWGQANNVKVGIAFGEFEDQFTATILNSEANVGSVSAYATLFNVSPIKIKISNDIADGRDIVFNLMTWFDDHKGEKSKEIIISIENGIEIKGIISEDFTLFPHKHYIITDNLVIPSGVTLIIKPGASLRFAENKSIAIEGRLIAIGKPDSLITFMKREQGISWNGITIGNGGNIKLEYCKISFAGLYNNTPSSILAISNSNATIDNTIFEYNFGHFYTPDNLLFDRCQVTNNTLSYIGFVNYPLNNAIFKKSNFINNSNVSYSGRIAVFTFYFKENIQENCIFNNFSMNKECNIAWWYSNFFIDQMSPNYFGTTNDKKINASIYDFGEDGSLPYSDISKRLAVPPKENHGIVWKVLVNGKDAQDQFDLMDPVGVGKQKFEVYFNRAMDKKYLPVVSMGVRYPYSQTAIAEQGSWSADSSIYTVYGTVGLNTGDGINTIRVTGAKDTDHFEIPIEDRRFRVVVNAAGSASTAFMATPGLGKIKLEWNNAKLQDGLGYNMYRMEKLNDTVLTSPVLINSALIADTLYTDFAVTPTKKYYYYYKIVRTNLAETDSSKIVATIPLTASKGDANGDLAVNVLDITTLVSYLLNQNPQPFIVEAADANKDGVVNVLDIIAVVKVISGGKKQLSSEVATNLVPAYIYLKPDKIKLRSDEQMSALQFTLKGSNLKDVQLSSLLEGFEFVYQSTDTSIIGLLFSYSGKTIPNGLQDILKVEAGNALLGWGEVMGGDRQGQYVIIIPAGEIIPVPSAFVMTAFPNPASGEIAISYDLPENAQVTVGIYNLYGQLISMPENSVVSYGSHMIRFQAAAAGIYICRLQAVGTGENKQQYSKDIKLIVIK